FLRNDCIFLQEGRTRTGWTGDRDDRKNHFSLAGRWTEPHRWQFVPTFYHPFYSLLSAERAAILPVVLNPVDSSLMFGWCEIHSSNPCSCGPAPAAAADEQGSCCCCRYRATAGRRLTRSCQYDLIDLRMQAIRPALHRNIVSIDRRIAIRNARGRLRIH